MDLGLAGRRALVTGGSRGIGLAVARRLVSEGVSVAICARGEDGIKLAVDELQELAPTVKVTGTVLNVADADALGAWARSSIEGLGGLDVYVHNASTGPMPGEKGWTKGMEVDLLALVRTVEAVEDALAESDAAAIVAIGTTAALEAIGAEPQAHFAIKAALIQYCSQLSRSLAPKGVRVNTVSPGPIYFTGGAWDQIKEHMRPYYDQTLASIPLGRMGADHDVANAVAFLASQAAGFVTGANLVVDGGFTRRVDF
jgi:NAD(P)-dependent dehydrogenase (short-subunit alcohol dehydrogenase family)